VSGEVLDAELAAEEYYRHHHGVAVYTLYGETLEAQIAAFFG